MFQVPLRVHFSLTCSNLSSSSPSFSWYLPLLPPPPPLPLTAHAGPLNLSFLSHVPRNVRVGNQSGCEAISHPSSILSQLVTTIQCYTTRVHFVIGTHSNCGGLSLQPTGDMEWRRLPSRGVGASVTSLTTAFWRYNAPTSIDYCLAMRSVLGYKNSPITECFLFSPALNGTLQIVALFPVSLSF